MFKSNPELVEGLRIRGIRVGFRVQGLWFDLGNVFEEIRFPIWKDL